MGLFDFFKPKKTDVFEKMYNQMFPKGEKDVNAGTDELLYILNSSVSRETARSIFTKATALSNVAEKFDEERLRVHLAGYCLQHFSEEQVKKFHGYLVALKAAMLINRKTPSEVRRNGDAYYW